MDSLAIPPNLGDPAVPGKISRNDSPAKIREAAQQFEALLLNQILQSVSEAGGWLGSGEDSSSACAGGLAQQQLAIAMAKNGGIGLAGMIEKGLQAGSAAPAAK